MSVGSRPERVIGRRIIYDASAAVNGHLRSIHNMQHSDEDVQHEIGEYTCHQKIKRFRGYAWLHYPGKPLFSPDNRSARSSNTMTNFKSHHFSTEPESWGSP